MIKICIIVPYKYPVPAVKGGAVETLVQFLVEQNEIEGKFDLTVLSTYDNEAQNKAQKYKKAEFVYFDTYKISDILNEAIYRALKKFFKIYIPYARRFYEILNYLKHHQEFDYILFENGLGYMHPLLSKVYPKEKILSHLHWTGDGNPKQDAGFEYLLPVSQYIANQWKKDTNRDEDKIIVWKNCCDERNISKEITEAEGKELKEKYAIMPDETVIICVGRLVRGKGVKELVEALDLISEKKIHLILVGASYFGVGNKSKYELEVDKICKHVKYRVSMTGFVDNRKLYLLYGIADIAVVPSTLQEAAPLSVIEAMTSGTALIATNVGGIPEYTDTDGALLVELNNHLVKNLSIAISQLIDNENMRNMLAERAKMIARQYTPQTYYRNFGAIIDRINNKRGCEK